MCGRARCTLRREEIAQMAGVDPEAFVDGDKYRPCENMGPGRYGPVVFRAHNDQSGHGERKDWQKYKKLQAMQWGLIPSFNKPNTKPDHFIMFNARSESLQERPAFRRLLETKRCVILSEGYYEWQQVDKREKQPYYIYRTAGPLKFAGLYDSWVNEEGEKSFSYTILTTEIPPQLSWMHTRIPVILDDEGATRWLSDSKFENLRDLLVGYRGDDLKWHPVDKRVGSTKFQTEDCSKKVDIKHAANITSFFGADKEQTKITGSWGDNLPQVSSKTEPSPSSQPESTKTSQAESTTSSQGEASKRSQDVLSSPPASSPIRLKPDRREEFRSPIKFLFQQQQMVQQAEEIMAASRGESPAPVTSSSSSMGSKRALSPNHPHPSPKKPRKGKPSPKKPLSQRGTLLAYFQPKS